MKVLLIATKEEFNEESIQRMSKHAEIKWITDEIVDLHNVDELFNDEDKILAISAPSINWVFPNDIYERLKNVSHIALATTSAEFLDLNKLKKIGIKVTNVPGYATNAVTEYAIFMLLALLKRYPLQLKSNLKEEFTKENLMDELPGKKVGIVGFGNIGSRLAEVCRNMEMQVSYWSRSKKNVDFRYRDLKDIVKNSDIIFPAYTLNKETQGLLSKEILEKLSESAYFVDIVGKEAYDFDYLLKRAESGKLAGFAYESSSDDMFKLKGNIFLTSTIGWYTKQALSNNIEIWTDSIISCIKGKPINVLI